MNRPHTETSDSRWQRLYVCSAITALISVVLVLLDIAVSIVLPAGEARPGARQAGDWFVLLQTNPLYGLRDLGLLNSLNLVLGMPVVLALYAVHQRSHPASAALAVALFLVGGAVYLANNPALAMFVLSQHAATATTATQRSVVAAAGEALLARGADFTLGSLPGFVLPSLAQLALSWIMLRAGIFSRATAATGLLGIACLLIFMIWATLLPASFETAMVLAVPGGLLTMAWNILVARRLVQLARGPAREAARPVPRPGALPTSR